MNRKMMWAAYLISVFSFSLGAWAQSFTYRALDVPNSHWTIPKGINPKGDVVGATADSTGKHGFIWHLGAFSLIDVPNATLTNAVGINAQGDVVGRWMDIGGMNHGYVLSSGQFKTLDISECNLGTVPHGINNSGEIVGQCLDASGNMHGFLLSGARVTIIDVAGAVATDAYKVTDEGYVVGYFVTTDQNAEAYLRSPSGAIATFTVPGGIDSGARGINESMNIVGQFTTVWDGHTHGFLLQDTGYLPINYPSAIGFTVASDINNRGTIVGDYFDSNGVDRGFVATPNP